MKPQDKREGGGAHNWGSVKDEVETAAYVNILHSWTAFKLPVFSSKTAMNYKEHKTNNCPMEKSQKSEFFLIFASCNYFLFVVSRKQKSGDEKEEEEEETVSELTLDEFYAQQEKVIDLKILSAE